MALGTDTARLQTVLTLKDGLSPGLNKPIGTVGKFNKGMDSAGKKVGAFTGKLKTAGVVAGGALAGGLFVGIKSGLQNLGELESATTSVDAALRQMGKAGEVTAAQIADWANEIESSVDAAFDDKAITNATTTLLRFGRVTTKNIRPAMEVMTDLAAKTGDVDSAATLLARSLADPTKAAGKLARQGIILTEAQEKQIKAFVEAGDAAGAQAVLLDAVATSTKGAAAAMNGPYVDAQRKLDDAVEDGTKALAVGFLPLITEVSEELRKGVADPGTMDNIRNFGKGLAGAFKEGLAFAKKIPWGAIADGLKTSAQWAGKLFDAFRSLPPEMQATIVALAGLSKLTGGAPIKIAVDFAKEGLKGVFGRFFDRGSSAANALWVKQVGLGSGSDNTFIDDGSGKKPSKLGKVFDALGKLMVVGMVAEFAKEVGPMLTQLGNDIADDLKLPQLDWPLPDQWPWGSKNVPTILPEIFGGNGFLGGTPAEKPLAGTGLTGGLGAPGAMTSAVTLGLNKSNVPIGIERLRALQRQLEMAKQAGDNTRAAAIKARMNHVAQRIDFMNSRMGAGMKEGDAKAATRAARIEWLERGLAQAQKAGDNARAERIKAKLNEVKSKVNEGNRKVDASKTAISGRLNTANTRLAQIRAKRMAFTTTVQVPVTTNVSVRNVNDSNTTQTHYGSKVRHNVI
jgi:hypothetical protein